MIHMKAPVKRTTVHPEAETDAWYSAAWMENAVCASADPETWFSYDKDTQQLAKSVCASCPVRGVCLADALAEEDGKGATHRFGIRGGMDPQERYARHRARTKAASKDRRKEDAA